MTKATEGFGDDFKEVVSGKFVNWKEDDGKGNVYCPLGSTIKGILVDVDERENTLKGGEMQKIYTLEDAEGSEFRVGSRGKAFDAQMKKIVKWQWVAFWYKEDIESKTKGNNPFKLIKVAEGQMDDAYSTRMAEEAGEVNVDDIEV